MSKKLPIPKVHFRYMSNGASCDPTRRTNITSNTDEVTCKSCLATKYYKNIKQKQQNCNHHCVEIIEVDEVVCNDCNKHLTLDEYKQILKEADK